MRFLIICLSLIGYVAAKEVTIATYNVENLFDATLDGTEYEEYRPSRYGWNAKLYRIKLEHTAEVLCDLDADIVGLQEIENERALRDLQHLLRRVGCAYRDAAITHKRGAPVQVALLSRYPIVKTRELQVSYAPKVRNILEATVQTPIEPIRLFVNHWKSKSREGYESKRIAYAKRLMQRLLQLDWTKPIVVFGDFNSDYDAYLGFDARLDDTARRSGINHILPTLYRGLPVDERTIRMAKAKLLYDLWYEVPMKRRWSMKFYGKRNTPDHILLNGAFFDGHGIEYRNGSFKVFKTDYLFTPKGYINRWENKHGRFTSRGYSDHLPLKAVLNDEPYRPQPNDYRAVNPKAATIDILYGDTTNENLWSLHDVAVVWKRRNLAVVKQSGASRGIAIYGATEGLREGECYDLIVGGLQDYKGLREATRAYVRRQLGRCDVQRFVHTSASYLRNDPKPNEVIAGIEGVYMRRRLYLSGGQAVRIYFKKRSWIPPEGSRIKIAYARLGYYKGIEIVIDDKRDFRIVE